MQKIMKALFLNMLMISSFSALAQQSNQDHRFTGQIDAENAAIVKEIEENKSLREKNPKHSLGEKEKFGVIALANKSQVDKPALIKATADNQYRCIQRGGYTVDYNDCMRAKQAYDQVLVAELAMMKTQEIRVNENNVKQMEKFNQAQQKGDGQNAAIDATIERNRMNAEMYNKQAIVYSTAVSYLGTMLSTWQNKGDKALARFCDRSKELEAAVLEKHHYTLSASECSAIMKEYKDNERVFANNDERGRFLMALTGLIQKAAEAKRRAGMNENVADRLADAKMDIPDDYTPPELDKCITDPHSIDCRGQGGGGRSGPGSFGGTTFEMGGAGAAQTFDFGPNGSSDGFDGSDGAIAGVENVADVFSPFEDAAREASGILDPAAAARFTPGSNAASGLGGGGGGGGGGGRASLGDDLTGATPDDNADPEIKTNKVTGKYGKGGKGGFQAVKSSPDKATNQFASLFDSKSSGGIEEDRSIASAEDIDGEASGLFQKISRRYGKVQQDKRIESENLE